MPDLIERTDREHFLADLQHLSAQTVPGWLKEIREDGARHFAEIEFPHYKEEAWRATNIAPILKTPFRAATTDAPLRIADAVASSHLFEAPEWTQLVFVNGFFCPELSPHVPQRGLEIGSIAEVVSFDDAFVSEHLDRLIEPTNAFIALNSAFLQDGAAVRVEKNASLEHPIHILHVTTGEHETIGYPRNLIILEESSEATIIETYVGPDEGGSQLSSVVTEIAIGDNARLHRYKVVRESDSGYHLATDRIRMGRDAYLENFIASLSGKIVRNELSVLMNGEGSECSLNGLYLNDDDRLIDNALNVEHAKSRCRSRMAYKGVLDGTSSAVFTGKVFVNPGAQRTDSDQLNNNLLLSDKATIDTKPQLEIFADDVKCTHGATVGSFPGELIFYFQSRGIDAERAHGILTYGFAEEIVDRVTVEPLREKLARYVFAKYSGDE